MIDTVTPRSSDSRIEYSMSFSALSTQSVGQTSRHVSLSKMAEPGVCLSSSRHDHRLRSITHILNDILILSNVNHLIMPASRAVFSPIPGS